MSFRIPVIGPGRRRALDPAPSSSSTFDPPTKGSSPCSITASSPTDNLDSENAFVMAVRRLQAAMIVFLSGATPLSSRTASNERTSTMRSRDLRTFSGVTTASKSTLVHSARRVLTELARKVEILRAHPSSLTRMSFGPGMEPRGRDVGWEEEVREVLGRSR